MTLREKYQKEIIPKMKEVFGYKNDLAVPKIEKVIVSIGTGPAIQDPKYLEKMEDTIKRITGQQYARRAAKKSIASFKIRKGLTVGLMVTLRKKRMYDFLNKLINVTLPRIRDFQGLHPRSIDQQGSLSIGIKEHVVFPEIKPDEVEKLHGVQVTVATTAKTKKEGLELLKLFGFPFKK